MKFKGVCIARGLDEGIQQNESHGVLPPISHCMDHEVPEAGIERRVTLTGQEGDSASSG